VPAQVTFIFVKNPIEISISTQHFRASGVSFLKLGVTGSIIVSTYLPGEPVFFAIQLLVFLTGEVSTVTRRINLLLATNSVVFGSKLTIMST
jgi:hypothetical protein